MGIENRQIPVDEDRTRLVIETLLKAREDRSLIFSEQYSYPETGFVTMLQEHAKESGDETIVLNALFMVTSLVFGQDTTVFFDRITNRALFESNSWVFRPREVVERAKQGEDIEGACMTYLQPAGYSRAAVGQWVHNSRVILEKFGGDIRNFFRVNDDDAEKVVTGLFVKPRAKTNQKEGLRRFGPKLAILFVQWVNQYGLYPLKNADKIGLPIDFQVSRVLIQTEGLPLKQPEQVHLVANKTLQPLLIKLCEENGWDPRVVSETLWRIGSEGCRRRLHDQCPVSDLCTHMISRTPYDKVGKFDPTDVGRFD